MSTISTIGVSFVANVASFAEGLTGIHRKTVKFSRGIKKDLSAAGQDITAIGKVVGGGLAVIGAGLLAGVAKSTAEISKMVDEAAKIGITASQFEALSYAARTTGSDMETVKRSFEQVQKSTIDAQNGNKTTVQSFNTLGISIDKLGKLGTEERFKLIVDGLSKIKDKNLQAKIGFDLMGKTFTEMLPIINGGAKGLKDAAIEAATIGQVLSDGDNKAVKQMGENWEWLGNLMMGAFNTLSATVAPIVNDLIDKFKVWITSGTNFRDTLLTVVNVFGTVALVVANIVDGFAAFIKLGSAAFSALSGIITGIVEFALKGVRLFTDQFLNALNKLIEAWNKTPFGGNVKPVKFSLLDDAITEMENLRKGSFDAMSEFGTEAGQAWSHGFGEKVSNVIGNVQGNLIKTNSDALNQVGRANQNIASANVRQSGIDAGNGKWMNVASDSFAKIGLLTSPNSMPEQKRQTEYLKTMSDTLKQINQAMHGGGSTVAGFAN